NCSSLNLFLQYCLRPGIPAWCKRIARPVVNRFRNGPSPLPPWLEETSLRRLGVPITSDGPKRSFSNWSQRVLYEELRANWAFAGALLALDSYAHYFGIEIRHPFLDRRLIEMAQVLPGEQRRMGAESKKLLRRAMAGILPEIIRNRTDKAEFS